LQNQLLFRAKEKGEKKMSKNQLAVSSIQSLAFGDLTEQDVLTIRETIGKDCNESQFKLFMTIAKNAGADPIHNEIYPAVRGGQLTVQFGIDYYIRKAKESEGFLGYQVQMVGENDDFSSELVKGEDGRYFVEINHKNKGFQKGQIVGGYCIAFKEGMTPYTVIMGVEEVEHYKKSNIGMQKTMWTNNFVDMFSKHLVKRALKAQFNLNDDQEQQSSQPESYDPNRQRVDITPTQNSIETDQGEINEEDELKKKWDAINKKIDGYGWSKDDLKSFIKEKLNKTAKQLSLSEVVGLAKLIDLQHAKENTKPAEGSKPDAMDINFDEYIQD
jgi:recombination protein RecT